jgi:hypothetical protein
MLRRAAERRHTLLSLSASQTARFIHPSINMTYRRLLSIAD